jgi:hypothetical protein
MEHNGTFISPYVFAGLEFDYKQLAALASTSRLWNEMIASQKLVIAELARRLDFLHLGMPIM